LTTDLCEACHVTTTLWTSLNVPFPHSEADLSACAACHNNQIATGLPATHCDTQDVDCVQCHASTVLWIEVSNTCGTTPPPPPAPAPAPTPTPTPPPPPPAFATSTLFTPSPLPGGEIDGGL
jgi:hypothetical protein